MFTLLSWIEQQRLKIGWTQVDFSGCAAFRCRLETWGLQCSKDAFVESNPDQAEPTASYCGVLIFNLFSEMIFSRMCFQLVDWWNHRRMYASYIFSSLMCHCRENRCRHVQYVRPCLILSQRTSESPKKWHLTSWQLAEVRWCEDVKGRSIHIYN